MATPKLLVYVLGAPGAGKGTQSDLIVKEFGWTHVSAGDLLRAEVQKGTEWGKQAENIMREGKMVPGSMIIGLLKGALSSGEHTKVLVDGFPRVLEQLHDFEQEVRPCNTALFYNVAEDIARQRLLQRAESSGRVDDNEETIHKRFVVFEEQSMPVVEALREQCRLSEVDAGAAPEEVYAATKRIIQQLEQELAASEAAAAAVAAAEAGPAGAADRAEAAGEAAAPAVAAEPAAAAAAEEQEELAVPVAAAAAAAPAAVADAVAADAAAAEAPAAVPVLASAEAPAEVAAPADAVLSAVQMDLSGIRTPIVICGPSGVGKGTLIGKLMAQHPAKFGFSVSHTTRDPRPGEQHGVHYYFTDAEAMAAQVAGGMFLEHATVHGNSYGTSLAAVARVSAEGKHCVLDIDVQGAQQVRSSALGERCLFIFVAPPSEQELERRLRNRGTETEEKVLQRLANATSEIAKAQEPGLFHHTLVNGMPVRQYMDVTVIPVLREGLKALNVARPDDPWQFLADYLVANKPLAHA
ncbi:hypothetical protein OEZ85_007512 [Tetradesmus obliquus]|uniref:adenylate kinase n=1 Tax=Tetradesmus obliquus TaxID=3088 RepID=A0ABY8THU5_TETOB|nr:hypothetical protein OEZ85_007512 [Tetradesmus obliquus]